MTTSTAVSVDVLQKEAEKHVHEIRDRLATCSVDDIRTVGEKSIQLQKFKLCTIRPTEWNDVLDRFEKLILEHSRSSLVLNTGFKIQSATPTRPSTEKEGTNRVIRGIIICVFKIFSFCRDGYRLHNILNLLLPFIASEDPVILHDLLELYLLSHRTLGYFRNTSNIHYAVFQKYLFRLACGFQMPLKIMFDEKVTHKDIRSCSTVSVKYSEEGGRAGKGSKEKKGAIKVGPIANMGSGAWTNPFDVYCKAIEGKTLSDVQKSELWTKIRYACGICDQKSSTSYLRVMFRAASLITTLHRSGQNRAIDFPNLFTERKDLIEELCHGLNSSKIHNAIKRDLWYLLGYLFQNRNKTGQVLRHLVPQEEGREFQGILLIQIKKLNQLGVAMSQEEMTGLTYFLSKFVVHPSGNKIVRESASMMNEFVDMMKHSSGEISILGIEFLYLISTVPQSVRRLVDLGVVNEVVKMMNRAVENKMNFTKSKKKMKDEGEPEEEEEEEEKDPTKNRKRFSVMYEKLFEYCSKLLIQLFKQNTTTLEMRELADLGFIKIVSHMLDMKNWKNLYGLKLVSDICTLVSLFMNRDPTSIPIWIQHGIYDTIETYILEAEKLDFGGEVLMILPRLMYSFSLNSQCKEKIIQKRLFPVMLGWTVNKKLIPKFSNYNVITQFASQLSLFLRNNRNQNAEFIGVVDGCIQSILEELKELKEVLKSSDLDLRIFYETKQIVEEGTGKYEGKILKREMTSEEYEEVKKRRDVQKGFLQLIRTFASHLSFLFKDNRVFSSEFVVRNGVKKCFEILTNFPLMLEDQEPRILMNPLINLFAHLFRHKPDETMKQVVDCSLNYSEMMEKKYFKGKSDRDFEDSEENRMYLYITFSSISCFSKMFKMLRSIMVMRNWKDTKLLKYMESLALMERRMKWISTRIALENEQKNVLEAEKQFLQRQKEREEFEKLKKERKMKKKKKKKKKKPKKEETEKTEESKKKKTKKIKEPVVVGKDPSKETIFKRIVKLYMASLSQLYNSIQKTMFQLLMGQDRAQQYQIGMFFNEVIINMVMKLVGSLQDTKCLDDVKAFISADKKDENLSDQEMEFTRFCFYAKLIIKDVHTLFYSQSHRNTNTYVLKSFVDVMGLDILLPVAKKIFLTYFDLGQYLQRKKKAKEENEMKDEEEEEEVEVEDQKKKKKKKKKDLKFDVLEQTRKSFDDVRAEGVLSIGKFIQKMVNLSYIVTSPVTRAMLLTAPDFSPSRFLKLVQIQVANVMVDLWDHPKLLKSSKSKLVSADQSFLILVINIISHIVRGTDDEDEKKSKKKFEIDNAAFSKLLSMGFEEYKCRVALKKTNNDLQAAIDFIVMNPDIKREDEDGDEELAKAMALSLQENESVPILRNEGMKWVFGILSDSNSESLSFPCADLLAVLVDQFDSEEKEKKEEEEIVLKMSKKEKMRDEEEEEEEEEEKEEEVSREERFAVLVMKLLEENKGFKNPEDGACSQFENVMKTILLLSQYRPSIKNWLSGQGFQMKKKKEELKKKMEMKKKQEDEMKDEEIKEVSIIPVILEVMNWIEKNEVNMAVWDSVLMYCFKILESLTRPELGTPSNISKLLEDMKEEKTKKKIFTCKHGEFVVPEVSSLRKKYISEENRKLLMEYQIRFLKNHIIDGTLKWNKFLRSKLLRIHKLSILQKRKRDAALAAKKEKKENQKKEKMEDEEDGEEEEEEDDEWEEEEEEEEEEEGESYDLEDLRLLEEYAPYSDRKLFGSTMKSFFGKKGRRKIRFPLAKETMECFFSLLFNLTADHELAEIAIREGLLDILMGIPSSYLTQKIVLQSQMIFSHLVEENELYFRKRVESMILEKLECRTKKKVKKKVVEKEKTEEEQIQQAIIDSLGGRPPSDQEGAGQKPQPKKVAKKVHTKLYVRILLNQLLDVLDEYVQRNPDWVFQTILDTCRIPPSSTPIVDGRIGGKKTKPSKSSVHLILKPDRNINIIPVKVEKTKKEVFEKLIQLYRNHPCLSFPPKGVEIDLEEEEEEEIEVEDIENDIGLLNSLFSYMIPIPSYPSLQQNHILHIIGNQLTCHEDVKFLLNIRLPMTIKTTELDGEKQNLPDVLQVQESFLDVLIKNLDYTTPTQTLRRCTKRIDRGEGIPGTEAVNNMCVEDKQKKLEDLEKQFNTNQKMVKYQKYRMSMFLLVKIAAYEPSIVFDRLSVFLKTYLGSDYDCPPIYFEVNAEVVFGISEFFRWVMDISVQKPLLVRYLCKLMVESGLVGLLGEVLRSTSLDNPLFPSMGNSVLKLLERITKELGGVKNKSRKRPLRWKGGRFPLKFKMEMLLSEEIENARQLLRTGRSGGLRRDPYRYYRDIVEESGLMGSGFMSPQELLDGSEEEQRLFQQMALLQQQRLREGRRVPRIGGGGGGGRGLGSFSDFLNARRNMEESSSSDSESESSSDEESDEEPQVVIEPVQEEDVSEDSEEDEQQRIANMEQQILEGLMIDQGSMGDSEGEEEEEGESYEF